MSRTHQLFILTLLITLSVAGCKTIYYSTWEKFGWEKRHLLVDQVQDARKQQEKTKKEFSSALDRFKATVNYDGGKLEKAYNKLKAEYDDCVWAADQLRGENAKVKSIAGDLFKEWQGEIGQQNNPDYRKLAQDQYDATLEAYNTMVAKTDEAEVKMDPVLQAYQDRVLLLKSSLNARAIASLETESEKLVQDIEALINEMNASIAEADEFIASMGGG